MKEINHGFFAKIWDEMSDFEKQAFIDDYERACSTMSAKTLDKYSSPDFDKYFVFNKSGKFIGFDAK